jgi:hypothetical protein
LAAAAGIAASGGGRGIMALRHGSICLAIGAATAVLLAAPIAGAQPLTLERRIALPHVAGRLDHMAIDAGRGRLFVAELGNGSVDAIALADGIVVHRIKDLPEPQGIGYAPKADVIAIACGGDGTVRLFHAGDFTPAGAIALGDDADDVRLDPRAGNVVVGYGNGGLAVIDPAPPALVATVPLAAHPEGFGLASGGDRAFVNVPDAGQIAVADMRRGAPIARWTVPGRHENFPIALDARGAVLATVFRSPAMLALLDAQRGGAIAQAPACGDADDVFFDEKRHRLYVSCGAGAVDVFRRDAGGLHPLARITTSSGARTSLFVPELDRLFVAARAHLLGAEAAILVFRPGD